MSWSTLADLRAQVQRLWDQGLLLAALLPNHDAPPLFPRRLVLKIPTSSELSSRFDDVRAWITDLKKGDGIHYRMTMREVRHRVLGTNAIPDEIWVDSIDDALALIGKKGEARRFGEIAALTAQREPLALPWLRKRPLKALELSPDWPRLLGVVAWLQAHPRPGIYLRQVDLEGVHSKFIEIYRGVLGELLDLVLPAEAIDLTATGTNQFCRRYGFLDKPRRIRFRMLDARHALLANGTDQDITINGDAFARLDPPVRHVFVTENEVNFLAFPPLADSMVVFGAGYGFEVLTEAAWLHRRSLHYWGDIDTHGFAILDQLRAQYPHAASFLMDHATLLAHESQWDHETQPVRRDLPRLNDEERALFDILRDNRLRAEVRLEQERIGFGWMKEALGRLVPMAD